MERDSGRNQRVVGKSAYEDGQSTVEFAIVTAAFAVVTVALAVLWHVSGDGLLAQHALASASHHVQGVMSAYLSDVLLY